MRINCTICTDIFNADSDISITECGHAFHSSCIRQWLERSSTCPHCRRRNTDRKLTKLFLNQLDCILTDAQPEKLRYEIENLRLDLARSTVELSTAQTVNVKFEKEAQDMREHVQSLQTKLADKDKSLQLVRVKAMRSEELQHQIKKISDECERLRKQLKSLSRVESIVKQTSEEAEQMLTNFSTQNDDKAVKELATYCVILKKELSRWNGERRQMTSEHQRLRRLLQESRLQCQQLQHKAQQLQQLEEQLVSVEHENARLHKQVKSLEAAVVSPSNDPRNSALTRLLSECPTPDEVRRLTRPVTADANRLHVIVPSDGESEEECDTKSGLSVSSASMPPPATSLCNHTSQPPSATMIDLTDDSPRVSLAKVTAAAGSSSCTAVSHQQLRQLRTARLASITASPTLTPHASRNPFVLKRPPLAKRATDCSKLKNVNLLKTSLRDQQSFALSVQSAAVAPSIRADAAADWDGLGGRSRPEVFPGARRARLNVKLNNGDRVMRIDNFFSSSK